MFVDASAIVSILTGEDDGEALAACLDNAASAVTSPIAIWEAAASVSRKTGRTAQAELADILSFLDLADVTIRPIDIDVTAAALSAFDRYGRRSGHPADLNMGDCFAYACAQTLKTALLFTGKDFTQTDVTPASP